MREVTAENPFTLYYSHYSHTRTYLQFSHADTAHVNRVNKSTGVTTAVSFGVSKMSDEDMIVISDSESDTETVCAEIEHYYSLEADDDLVDASMDIRYDLEWASGAWLDFTIALAELHALKDSGRSPELIP